MKKFIVVLSLFAITMSGVFAKETNYQKELETAISSGRVEVVENCIKNAQMLILRVNVCFVTR